MSEPQKTSESIVNALLRVLETQPWFAEKLWMLDPIERGRLKVRMAEETEKAIRRASSYGWLDIH